MAMGVGGQPQHQSPLTSSVGGVGAARMLIYWVCFASIAVTTFATSATFAGLVAFEAFMI